MVIESGSVAMSSGRAYKRQTRDRSSVRTWGEVLGATTSPRAQDSRTITQRETETEALELYQNYSAGGKLLSTQAYAVAETEERKQVTCELRISTEYRPMTLIEFFRMLVHQRQEDFRRFLENYRVGMKTAVQVTQIEAVSEEVEDETTAFAAAGKVRTSDGREIEFDTSLFMNRHYERSSGAAVERGSARLTDPLVVNFGTGSAELTDRRFEFDIDCDGELDNIAVLGQACGYLALDLNEDGVIGDGSELFGTRSGDGFADLAVYDLDGNGWIDENDPVFDRLRIWSRDADGTERLAGLAVRGIGAICLMRNPTQFSLKDAANETQGIIRSTGVFLREDGSAGTIQQLDLAKREIRGNKAG